MHRHVWKYRNVRELGLANLVSKRIAEYEWSSPGSITDVRGCKELLLASDYGGHHKNSAYDTYAFLITNISDSGEWNERREWFRSKILTDGRKVSFKGIRGQSSIKILNDFLSVADYLPGIVVTFVISKQLGRLMSNKGDPCKFFEFVYPECGWNMRSFDRLSLIAHLGSLLVGGLCGRNQDLLWVTDEDEIAANDKKH